MACREVLRYFLLSDTEMSVEQNLCHAHAHHNSLMCQWVAAEDAPEMAELLDAKHENMQQIIEKQAHGVHVAAISQMQLQAMKRVEAQERELRRLSALLVEHQAILRSSPERPHQVSPKASPPRDLGQLRHEVTDILPSTVNTVRRVGTGQVPTWVGHQQ